MADEPIAPQPAPLVIERTGDFVSSYANSVIFQSTAWDLKVIFGQVDQVLGQTVITQHLAVSVPWAQAKLAIFWLQTHVIAHELETGGPVRLRQDVIPPPPTLTPEQQTNPIAQKYLEALKKLHEEFIAGLA